MSWTHCRRQSQMMDGALAGHDHTKGVAVAMVRRESETRFWYRDYGEEGQRTGGEGAKARHRPLVYSRLTRHDAHCCCGASAVAVGSSFPHRRFGLGTGDCVSGRVALLWMHAADVAGCDSVQTL